MLDLSVGPGGFEPPFAETSFHASCLDLLLKEINLTAQRLALLVHGVVMVDLGHEAPVVDSEFVEFSLESSKGGATSSQGG